MGFEQVQYVRPAFNEARGRLREQIPYETEKKVNSLGDVSIRKSFEGSS